MRKQICYKGRIIKVTQIVEDVSLELVDLIGGGCTLYQGWDHFCYIVQDDDEDGIVTCLGEIGENEAKEKFDEYIANLKERK